MATFEQIKSVRLTIHDPLGFIDIVEVADIGSLPVTPSPQTVYTVKDSGIYQKKDTAWTNCKLLISDANIKIYIDLYGVDKATVKSVKYIFMALGQEIKLARMSTGSETFDFTPLNTMYDFYKEMIKMLTEDIASDNGNSTGCFVYTPDQQVGGVYEYD